MFRSSRRLPWFNAVCYAVITFIVCSFVPMWQVMHYGGWCGYGRLHILWVALWKKINALGSEGTKLEIFEAITITQGAMLLAGITGYFVAWRRQAASDSLDPSAPN